MKRRLFRKPNPYVAFAFGEDWREVSQNDTQVTVHFGSTTVWPPATRSQAIGKLGTFEEECERTLSRGYVEVDAKGQALKAPTEAQRIEAILKLDLYVAFEQLRELLTSTKSPEAVLRALLAVLARIESDLDEHDAPFPNQGDVPPDMGAVRAYRKHFGTLLEQLKLGRALTAVERGYTYRPAHE